MYLFLHFRSLLDGLDDPLLENWRDVINLQRHWNGECNGTTFEFELEDNSSQNTKQTLTIFTTNPEYICNAACIAVLLGVFWIRWYVVVTVMLTVTVCLKDFLFRLKIHLQVKAFPYM